MHKIYDLDYIFENDMNLFRKKVVIIDDYSTESFIRNYVLYYLKKPLVNTQFISLDEYVKEVVINNSLTGDSGIINNNLSEKIISEIINNHKNEFSYFRDEINSITLCKKVNKCLQETRLCKINPDVNYESNDFKEFMDICKEYDAYLDSNNILSYPKMIDIVLNNLDVIEDNCLFIFFKNQRLTHKEQVLRTALETKFDVMSVDLYESHTQLNQDSCYFYRSRGKRNEVYNVFNIIKNKDLRLNDIEIIYTDKSYIDIISSASEIYNLDVCIDDGYSLKRSLVYETVYNIYLYLLDDYKSQYLINIYDIGLFRGNIKSFKNVLKMSKYIKPNDLKTYGEFVKNRHLEFRDIYEDYKDYDVERDIEFFNELSILLNDKSLDTLINYKEFNEALLSFLNKYKKIKSERESNEKIVLEKIESFGIVSSKKVDCVFKYFNELFSYLDNYSLMYKSVQEENGILIRPLLEKRPISRDYVFILGLNSDTSLPLIKDNPVFFDKYADKFAGYETSLLKNKYNLDVIFKNIMSFNGQEMHLSYVFYDEINNIECSSIYFFDEIRCDRDIQTIDFLFNKDDEKIKIYKDIDESNTYSLDNLFESIDENDSIYRLKNQNKHYLDKLRMNETSASKLITLFENPLNSIYVNGLNMKKDEEKIIKQGFWLSSSDRGNLMHKILEIYYTEMIHRHNKDGKNIFRYDEIYLNKLIDDLGDDWRDKYPPLFEKFYENEKDLIKKTLFKYVYDESLRNSNKDILGCEISFGYVMDKTDEGIEPMKISLYPPLFRKQFNNDKITYSLLNTCDRDNRLDLLINGSIDRLDYDKENNRLIFVDYKTGKEDNFKLYKAIQGRIYELAFKEYLKKYLSKFEFLDMSTLTVEYEFIFLNIEQVDEENTPKIRTYYYEEETIEDLLDETPRKDTNNLYLPMMLLGFNLQLIDNNKIDSEMMRLIFEKVKFLNSKEWLKDNWKYGYLELKDAMSFMGEEDEFIY